MSPDKFMIRGDWMQHCLGRFLSLLLLLFPAAPAIPAGASETVPSKIREVMLFTDQALVTREAAVRVKPGLHELILDVEAFRVDPDSVTARVFGDGEILGVQFREVPLREAAQENIRALEEKLRSLRQTERGLNDGKEVLAKKEQFLKSVVAFSEAQVPKDIKTSFPRTEDLEKTLRFLGTNFEAVARDRRALDGKIEDIRKDIRVAEQELSALRRPAGKGKKVIEVTFRSTREQRIRVEASYLARAASWGALYRASVPAALDGVDLSLFAQVRQKTGEDWEGVSLSLSNVIPLKGIELPEPAPWVLSLPRPAPRAYKRAEAYDMSRMKAALAAPAPADEAVGGVMEEEAPAREAAFVSAAREASALSFEYRIPQAVSIESRDKETVLPILTRRLKGEFFLYTVPRVGNLAFLVCRTASDAELLSGPLNVYFGGRYVGKTTLAEKRPGKDFDLNLGADRGVKVQRAKTRDRLKETLFGMDRSTVVRELAYTLTVENLKDRPVTVKVLDAVPVSRTDRIQVRDLKFEPQPKEKDVRGQEGVCLWEVVLKPGEKRDIGISFEVAYPKDSPPVGL
jgi:uncharacterized protein (TIGR02231 family)